MNNHIQNFGRLSLGKSSRHIGMAASRMAYTVGRLMVYMDAEGDVWGAWVDSLHARRVITQTPEWVLGTWTAEYYNDAATARDIAENIDAERLARIAQKHRRAA